jgi:tryptophanase
MRKDDSLPYYIVSNGLFDTTRANCQKSGFIGQDLCVSTSTSQTESTPQGVTHISQDMP